MLPLGPRRFLAVALVLAAGAVSGIAAAHGGGGGAPPPPLGAPTTPAEQAFVAFESKKREPAVARVVVAPLAKARTVLERSRGARVAGDAAHSRMLDALALEWIASARDLERAAAAEAVLATTAAKARDSATKAERARALLAETQSRKERTSAELVRAEADAAAASQRARDAEGARIEKGAKGPRGPGAKGPEKKAPEKKPKGGEKAPKKK